MIGEPCAEPQCNKRGYHFVPACFVSAEVESDPRIGKRFDRYLLVDRLGAGGFGTVYRAVNTALKLTVAVKILTAAQDAPQRSVHLRMFKNEALALAQLSHPNIVRFIDAGVEERVPFIVMEYIGDAQTLRAEIVARAARGERLSSGDARRFLLAIVGALEAAHAAHIIHRDIKPENVMIQSVPGHPSFVRVLDLGLAKFVGDSSRSLWAAGTPRYMAPEQLWAQGLGPWTDLYAVGVLAYELMTGRSPFGRTPAEIIASKRDERFDALRPLLGLGVPAAAQAFLLKALAFNPAARFRTAAELRAALEDAYSAIETANVPALNDIELTQIAARDEESEATRSARSEPWSAPLTIAMPANEVPSRTSGRPAPAAGARPWRRRLQNMATALALVVGPLLLTSGSTDAPPVDPVTEPTLAPALPEPTVEAPSAGPPAPEVATVEPTLTSEAPTSLEEASVALATVEQEEAQREAINRRNEVARKLTLAKQLAAGADLPRAAYLVRQILALRPHHAEARALAAAIAIDLRWLRRLDEIGALASPAEQRRALSALASPPPGSVAARRMRVMLGQVGALR